MGYHTIIPKLRSSQYVKNGDFNCPDCHSRANRYLDVLSHQFCAKDPQKNECVGIFISKEMRHFRKKFHTWPHCKNERDITGTIQKLPAQPCSNLYWYTDTHPLGTIQVFQTCSSVPNNISEIFRSWRLT